jgi:hypothetical protein
MQIIDPRQTKAIQAYQDPTSPTFGNIKQSMISAGYDDEYANSISGRKPAWLTETIQDTVDMVRHAEKNLKRYATMHIDVDDKNAIDWARLQVDVSKYITKTLASKKYSENKEAEAPNVQINIVNYGEKAKETTEPIDVEPK